MLKVQGYYMAKAARVQAPSLLENKQGMMGTLETNNETRADQRRFSPQRVALKRVATTEIANGPPFQPQIME